MRLFSRLHQPPHSLSLRLPAREAFAAQLASLKVKAFATKQSLCLEKRIFQITWFRIILMYNKEMKIRMKCENEKKMSVIF